ncbi:class II aldolase/adducin family protein [Bordetella pseudohinzii]|uniref:Aldolase n=2 Tax=Bordetella pseudohinzii TaxID=1331258 RepID=A0A0M7C305_9BORD|nr:class II aldolase/adducin family protein [Bordetella pseudohinzii]ANY16560.1 aldolase [Bordetella pseudohinzii]KXA82165.1 aldolase [Bordetella pseudohinzii]CUI32663.1 L-fuculose phosphate aldolase [Bordetella pseudohinzii]
MCNSQIDVGVAAYADDVAAVGPAASRELIEDLVIANHILFDQGIVDAFGHVSVRHDQNPDRFLLTRNMAPATVSADDIVEFLLDGTPVNAAGRAVYLERFIHGEIYKARPDVQAIVHSHSPSVLPFSVSQRTRLRPICHMSGFLGGGTPVFEIREAAGDGTDLLICNQGLGAALAQRLGKSSVVLMRGHGSTVVGPSLKHAVYRAVYAEVNARLQVDALRLGEVTYLSDKEAETAQRHIETQIDRPWEMWKKRVQ